ncbi:MAG: hypothetical protein Q4C71_01035 [Microbacteriaceae bacterium]|nr:hypothetical protein [Microbacteriaceae bacterium]
MKNRFSLSVKLFWVSVVLWILAVAGEFLYYKVIVGSLACKTSVDSVFGEAGWSWLPLGHTCTWSLPGGGTATSYPTMTVMLVPLILALWGLSLLVARGRKRDDI